MPLWRIVLLLLSRTIMVQVAKSFSFCLYDSVFEMSLLFLYMMMMLTCILRSYFLRPNFFVCVPSQELSACCKCVVKVDADVEFNPILSSKNLQVKAKIYLLSFLVCDNAI